MSELNKYTDMLDNLTYFDGMPAKYIKLLPELNGYLKDLDQQLNELKASNEFNPDWDVSSEVLAELMTENQELKANNARMREAFNEMDVSLISMGSDGTLMPTVKFQNALRVYGETKQQSLAEIQAKAVESLDIKSFINANVWDGENRAGTNDWVKFSPDDLQELMDDMQEHFVEQLHNNQSEVDK